MVIEKVSLYDQVVEKIDGEFEVREINHQVVPAMLTNYAIEQGHRLGMLKTSLISDVLAISESFVSNGGDPEAKGEVDVPKGMMNDLKYIIDDSKITSVIYLACVGANRKFEYSYDEFLDKYHADISLKISTYMKLITGLAKNDKNKFASEFKKTTAASKKK